MVFSKEDKVYLAFVLGLEIPRRYAKIQLLGKWLDGEDATLGNEHPACR